VHIWQCIPSLATSPVLLHFSVYGCVSRAAPIPSKLRPSLRAATPNALFACCSILAMDLHPWELHALPCLATPVCGTMNRSSHTLFHNVNCGAPKSSAFRAIPVDRVFACSTLIRRVVLRETGSQVWNLCFPWSVLASP